MHKVYNLVTKAPIEKIGLQSILYTYERDIVPPSFVQINKVL